MEQNTQTHVEICPPRPEDELVPDLPPGPLDKYRKQASFNWKSLRLVLEVPELLRLKNKVWRTLEAEPDFQHCVTTPSCEEQKRRTARQVARLQVLWENFIPPQIHQACYKTKTRHLMTLNESVALVSRGCSVKFGLGVTLFSNALPSLGTARHLKYVHAALRGEIMNAFAITEVAHGSNTKKLRTTATYDPSSEEFVINTPDFEAAKCWAGNLGRTATHAIVYAQLRTADGEKHGLHGFITPLRDPATLSPYQGVTVGDMGEKAGLNGIDNGFLMFNKYRIPRENLLNRTGDVNDEGSYESSFTNPEHILGAALENLSAGRVAITQESNDSLCCAVVIAVRYAALRQQFGSKDDEEVSIIEYPLHQWRLFPYLAAACVFKIFVSDFTDQYLEAVQTSYSSTAKFTELSVVASEIHAIISSCKPLVSWVCRDAIQEAREACGGHGYLQAANLGTLRADHDPTVTYEGDNNVLIQQTSNWLLRQWARDPQDVAQRSPLASIRFLEQRDTILRYRFNGSRPSDVLTHMFVSSAMEWLLCWLMSETDARMAELQAAGMDRFTARNHSQIYRARTLSLVFAENNSLRYTWHKLSTPGLDQSLKTVLERLYLIYGLYCIDKHLSYFYQGGFAAGPQLASLVREGLMSQCADLVPDAVAIADAISPPDFALNSVLGRADGRLYDNLKRSFLEHPGAMERPPWWREAVPAIASKL